MYDGNGNGTIDIEDFLGVLSLFGDVDSDSDGLWDSQDSCVDLQACNYGIQEASECLYPDAVGDCDGSCMSDLDGDGVCDWNVCGDPLHYQGYHYATVIIGGQCWFSENLRSENYQNGEEIDAGLSNSDWAQTNSGAVAVYGEEPSNLDVYGRLYNWFAVDDNRGLCPTGWHVPTDEEWTVLTDELGGIWEAGYKMKTTFGWTWDGNGSNSSGFSGLPGGSRSEGSGNFGSVGQYGYWWSSSQGGSNSRFRMLAWNQDSVWDHYYGQSWGFSVRCIQDSE